MFQEYHLQQFLSISKQSPIEMRENLKELINSEKVTSHIYEHFKHLIERQKRVSAFEQTPTGIKFIDIFKSKFSKELISSSVIDFVNTYRDSTPNKQFNSILENYIESGVVAKPDKVISYANICLGGFRASHRCEYKAVPPFKETVNNRLIIIGKSGCRKFLLDKLILECCDVMFPTQDGVHSSETISLYNEVRRVYYDVSHKYPLNNITKRKQRGLDFANIDRKFKYGTKIDIESAFNYTMLPTQFNDLFLFHVFDENYQPVTYSYRSLPIGFEGSMAIFEFILSEIMAKYLHVPNVQYKPNIDYITKADDIVFLHESASYADYVEVLEFLKLLNRYYRINLDKLVVLSDNITFFGKTKCFSTGELTDARRTSVSNNDNDIVESDQEAFDTDELKAYRQGCLP